jgi:hypothetical protein
MLFYFTIFWFFDKWLKDWLRLDIINISIYNMATPKKIKKTQLKGRIIKYVSLADLKRKENIVTSKAKELIKKKQVIRYVVDNNLNFAKYDAKKKPDLLRKFGIKRISNASILATNIKIKNNKILGELPKNVQLKMTVQIQIIFNISDEIDIERNIAKNIITSSDNLDQSVNAIVQQYMIPINGAYDVRIAYEVFSTFTQQKFELKNNRLREEKPLNIFNEYVNVELNNNKDCGKAYLLSKLGRIKNKSLIKDIKKLGNIEGIEPIEIINFCKLYNIPCYIYKFGGQLYLSNIPLNHNKSKMPNLIFLTYNNHLYPMKNKFLQKRIYTDLKIKIVENCEKELLKFLENMYDADIEEGKLPILPSNLKFNGTNILSFIVNDTKYIENSEYNDCLKVLKKFGIQDKIYDGIKKTQLFGIIEKIYVKENIQSYLPITVSKGGFNYHTTSKVPTKGIATIDMVKAYSSCLRNLPYLIKTDYRVCKIYQNPETITDHYLYVVKPKDSTILLPDTNIYWGEHVRFCKEVNLEFEILEELTTTKIDVNYYSEMIDNLFNQLDNNLFKDTVNIGIGKFETFGQVLDNFEAVGIFNNEEARCHSGYARQISKEYQFIYNSSKNVSTIYNKMPIAIQIKDMARRNVYMKMVDLKLTNDKIIQVNTDAITYIGKLPDNLGTKLGDWQEKEYAKRDSSDPIDNEEITFVSEKSSNNNVIGMCYAGAGKTYYIIHDLIPKLKMADKNFIVLSPSHVSLEEYKKAKINCNVIQKFSLSNTLPSEEVIIIDEFGMCDRKGHDILIKSDLLNKECHAFGDFKQLPPAGESTTLSSKQYIESIFSKTKLLEKNRRNTFTKSYYDNLINGKLDLIKEVKKHSTKTPLEADVIICWRNSTVDSYNQLYMCAYDIEPYDIGLKLMCIDNDLHAKNIYNHFVETIVSNEDDIITLSNGSTFTKEEIDKHFKPAYAKTVYGVQGKSINSYYYAPEDYQFIDGRTAYTVISRLKTEIKEIINKPEEGFELNIL